MPNTVGCGIAWGYCAPYRSSGDIPPELFKGRHTLAANIARGEPTGIIYGGRQFGKTALLRTVERQYHRPEDDTYVIFIDIKHLGHPTGTDEPKHLWALLRKKLATYKLINSNIRNEDATIDAVVTAAKTNPRLRLILLLDEADNFLDQDARDGYRELERIRKLQEDTSRQVKIVLSGLHNVQRFYTDSNHPFAQLGGTTQIGPLPPQGARALIEEPLGTIGFTFDTPTGKRTTAAERIILRILSYTNYHPALIQHFCGELIQLVRQTRVVPPYVVTISDVEAVYRKPEVQAEMKNRLEWTIDLDNRYKVIVYGMIFAQLEDNNGFRKTFSAREIHDDVKVNWPEGFADVQTHEIQALLDELIGLGVLIRLDNGHYRLRNGNVVRALGTPDEILVRLDAAAKLPPPETQNIESFRLRLDRNQASPLTVRQLRDLTQQRSGAGVIFGSDALLLDQVEQSLRLFIDSSVARMTDIFVHKMPVDCVTKDQLLNHVDRLYSLRGHQLVFCPPDHLLLNSDDLKPTMEALINRLSSLRSKSRSVRYIFALGVPQAVAWFQQLGNRRTRLEDRLVDMATIPLWDTVTMGRFFFDEPINIQKLVDATGGWPCLVAKVAQAPGSASAAMDELHAALENTDNRATVRDEFAKALSFGAIPLGTKLLRFVKQLGSMGWDEIIDHRDLSDDDDVRLASEEQLTTSLTILHRVRLLRETKDGLIVDPVAAKVIPYADATE